MSKGDGIVGVIRDINPEVESTVGGREAGQPHCGQLLVKDVVIFLVALDVDAEFSQGVIVKHAGRRDLRKSGSTERNVS